MTSPDPAVDETHGDVGGVDASDGPGHFEAQQPALTWRVTAEPNPFARQLVFNEDDEEFLWWQLDPLALNTLLVALTQVRDEQLAALAATLGAQEPITAASSTIAPGELIAPVEPGDDPNDPPFQQPPTFSLAWWAQHKLLAFLIAMTILLFAVGFINGPG